ncbi:MAG: hypothetical protein M1816_001265 [Peltula sp. TS41687]|nr:MAG: hypothetical protein M1816_001265 [Peltula sp. TS41687]
MDSAMSSKVTGPVPQPLQAGTSTSYPDAKSSGAAPSGDDTSSQGRPSAETGTGTSKGPVKERRHQIPGLRQTPYLKIYLLRCDDNDTYKTSSRKLLREWIKANASSQSSSSTNAQENHDAFEWLIVHVVLPNTFAASQPSTAGSSGGISGAVMEKPGSSGSRWPGKGSSTVLEKIKADFNGSSKASPDRVAQIRLHITDIPPHLLPDVSQTGPPSSNEDQDDQEIAWSDLITKFKSLILASFNLRVIQYEEDIRQRDAQRSLPGWNFCTFFILKEGLARGFESVGLLEDALVVYDELSVSLDMTAREVHSDKQGIGGSTFLQYTKDLRLQAEAAIFSDRSQSTSSAGGNGDKERKRGENVTIPLSETKKGYRDLILSNKISLFDFRCYLFARQMSLLLRQANAWLSRTDLMSRVKVDQSIQLSPDAPQKPSRALPVAKVGLLDGSEDLSTLAELSERGVDFIPSVARIMRADLWNAIMESKVGEHSNAQTVSEEQPLSEEQHAQGNEQLSHVIDNIVHSWTFSVSHQILAETYTKYLPTLVSSAVEAYTSNVKLVSHEGREYEPKTIVQEPKTTIYPSRRSSLAPHQLSQSEPRDEIHPSLPVQKNDILKTGLEELAYHRAELYLLERSALKQLGHTRGWAAELGGVDVGGHGTHSTFEDVPLDAKNTPSSGEKVRYGSIEGDKQDMAGIENELVCKALNSSDTFYRLYEILTDNVLRLFTMAKKADQLGDYATAANHFSRLAPAYVDKGWNSLGSSMLRIYAHCLKELDRKEDYVRKLLELIARAVVTERRNQRQGGSIARNDGLEQAEEGTDDDADYVAGYLSDLVVYSKDLPSELTAPLNRYFGDVQVEPHPAHFSDKDGFRIQLKISHLLRHNIRIDKVRVRMTGIQGSQSQEIWLESDEILVLKRGVTAVWIGTHAMAPGSYIVDQVTLQSQNIVFIHETLSRPNAVTPIRSTISLSGASVAAVKKTVIRCYPQPTALEAKLELARHVALGESRSIEVCISSGRNDISRAELRIRSASAGLRLKTAEAKVSSGSIEIKSRPRPGVLELGTLSADSLVKFRIPYALEHELPEITAQLTGLQVKIEVDYTTKAGDFSYFDTCNVLIVLPLGVNVQDIFRENALFSKFTISTASSVPIRVVKSNLEGSDMLKVQSPGSLVAPLIASTDKQSVSQISEQRRLALVTEYSCLDDEIECNVGSVFTNALMTSQYESLSRLLLPHLLSSLRSRSSSELATAGLLGEVDVGPFENLRWDECLRALAPDHRTDVRGWLQAWHEKHRVIVLRSDLNPNMNRKITIPVEVPRMQVVHTADLTLIDDKGRPLGDDATVTVGQTLAAELRIRHTRNWAFVTSEHAPDAPIEFIYDIQPKPDTWLIGGRRRAQFSAKVCPPSVVWRMSDLTTGQENEEHIFPVILLPLQSGHLLLPTVDIKPFVSVQPRTQRRSPSSLMFGTDNTSPSPQGQPHAETRRGGPGRPIAPITCETDNRNQAQTILVLQDRKSTTVSLDLDLPGSGAVLIEADSRCGRGVARNDMHGNNKTNEPGGSIVKWGKTLELQ